MEYEEVPVPPLGDLRAVPPFDFRGEPVVLPEFTDGQGIWLQEVWPSWDQDRFGSLEEADAFARATAKGRGSRAPRPAGCFGTRAAEVWELTTSDGSIGRPLGRVEIDDDGTAHWVW